MLNIYPMAAKSRVSPKPDNVRTNPYIFVRATGDPSESSAVLMNQKGDIGRYNRANRSIHHFIEYGFGFLATLPLAFFTFPFPTMICIATFCLGQILYQIGYANAGFGMHIPGFYMERFSTCTLSGLLLIAAVKSF